MFAQVMSGELTPGDVDTFISMIRDRVIPRAKDLPGFAGGYWLADRSTGKVPGITLYESEEALDATAAQAERIREESSAAAGMPAPSFHSDEVVAWAETAEPRAA